MVETICGILGIAIILFIISILINKKGKKDYNESQSDDKNVAKENQERNENLKWTEAKNLKNQ